MSDPAAIDPAKRAELERIISLLHDGVAVDEVKRQFAKLIDGVSAAEVAALEQALIDGGLPVEEVQRLCEVHVQVFERSLQKEKKSERVPGHPVHTLYAENREARARARRLKRAARSWAWGMGKPQDCAAALDDLANIKIHYARKENQLFPYLEKHGFTGPSKVMWGKHDEIRAAFGDASEALEEGAGTFRGAVSTLCSKIQKMIFMEEHILIPEAVRKLSDREWAEIRAGEDAIGFAWVRPEALYDPGLALSAAAPKIPYPQGEASRPNPAESVQAEGPLELATGRVSKDLLDLSLCLLPIDISIVDENDKVAYYSDSPHRIFPRSPAVIGRSVQNCHPPSSVATVNRILAAFKDGSRDKARFWIQMEGKFIVIEYYALRDSKNAYRGTLEVSQDILELKSLEGQRRLLDWE